MGSNCKQIFWELWSFMDIFVILFIPILCLPLIIAVPTSESYCGYVLLVMALYWVFECMPISVTSLIPLALFPVFGIMDGGATASMYFKDTSALLLGGIMMAIAIENWNLHRRIALGVLMISGTKPRWLLLGFMLVTWFLSMWISNSATTSMMLPIAQAVLVRLSEIKEENKEKLRELESHHIDIDLSDEDNGAVAYVVDNGTMDTKPGNDSLHKDVTVTENRNEVKETDNADDFSISEEYKLMGKALMLAICYSSSIGGTCTLIGTPPNLILLGQLDDRYPDHPLNFLSWFVFSFPSSLVFIFLAWLWLLATFLELNPCRESGCRSCSCSCETSEEETIIKNVLKNEYEKLGAWSWAELSVLTMFVALCLFWISRDIGGYGWCMLFPEDYITDATPAIFMSIVLFCFPSEFPNFYFLRTKEDSPPSKPRTSLLNWQVVNKKMPWSLFLLLGGGFALAEGMEMSGLSQWIGDLLTALDGLSDWVIVLICGAVACFFTEITSNTAVATILIPILISLAETTCINPLYITVPCTILVSYAFMLPVATAPNAMVFSNGLLTIPDMALTGFFLSVFGIIWITFWVNSWGNLFEDIDTYPEWAMLDNTTCVDSAI
ncbi:Na(+)/citrate cotransporter-like [Saccoglossus kowalevskii]